MEKEVDHGSPSAVIGRDSLTFRNLLYISTPITFSTKRCHALDLWEQLPTFSHKRVVGCLLALVYWGRTSSVVRLLFPSNCTIYSRGIPWGYKRHSCVGSQLDVKHRLVLSKSTNVGVSTVYCIEYLFLVGNALLFGHFTIVVSRRLSHWSQISIVQMLIVIALEKYKQASRGRDFSIGNGTQLQLSCLYVMSSCCNYLLVSASWSLGTSYVAWNRVTTSKGSAFILFDQLSGGETMRNSRDAI